MRLRIVPKARLSELELREATERIFAADHVADVGPRHTWKRPDHDRHQLALFDLESDEFVGTVYCVITPPVVQDFTWWLDSRMRKKGYWRALADDLAAYLKKNHAIEKIGFIVFGRTHNAASQKIAQRLRAHFEKKPAITRVVVQGTGPDGEPSHVVVEAVRRYHRAAEEGNATAQFILGTMYAQGRGLPKDEAEAVRWYELAARHGSEYAQAALRRLGKSY